MIKRPDPVHKGCGYPHPRGTFQLGASAVHAPLSILHLPRHTHHSTISFMCRKWWYAQEPRRAVLCKPRLAAPARKPYFLFSKKVKRKKTVFFRAVGSAPRKSGECRDSSPPPPSTLSTVSGGENVAHFRAWPAGGLYGLGGVREARTSENNGDSFFSAFIVCMVVEKISEKSS